MTNIVNYDFEKKSTTEFIQFDSADRYLGRLPTQEKLISKSQLREALNCQNRSITYIPISSIPAKAVRQSIMFLGNRFRGHGIVVPYF